MIVVAKHEIYPLFTLSEEVVQFLKRDIAFNNATCFEGKIPLLVKSAF